MSMRTTIHQNQVMTQKLVMTPKLQQAIKILQMPRLELAQYVSQQLVENIALEESYDEPEEIDTEDESENDSNESESEGTEANTDLEIVPTDDTEASNETDSPELDITNEDFGDVDWENYFLDSAATNNEWETPVDEGTRDTLANESESLEEHLLWQLRMSALSEEDIRIGEAIIGNIDDDGYLTTDNAELEIIIEIAELMDCKAEDVERLLSLIQTFDPAGVGSRNLEECLLIQLEQLGLANTAAYEIVEEGHIQDLEANRLPQIAKNLKVDIELVRAASDAISALEPKPGRQYSSTKPGYVFPEVSVIEIDGQYRIIMNDFGPSLRLSSYYQHMLKSQDVLASEERNYIRSKVQSAQWLIESIEHRRRTILRVTESIFDVQKGFLDKGPAYLKPLTLKEIADRIGVHEATVSRATRGRYVQTPRGVFELKYFFTSAVSTENGNKASSEAVKASIKNMIATEDPKSPLSDSEIERRLKQEGFKVARRTIAKYRDGLGIPSSNKRKQW